MLLPSPPPFCARSSRDRSSPREGFTRESAEAILESGDADLVAFGRSFAANPDLPKRLKYNLPLNPYDRSAFWGGTERGYNDYPFYEGKGETCFAHELQI